MVIIAHATGPAQVATPAAPEHSENRKASAVEALNLYPLARTARLGHLTKARTMEEIVKPFDTYRVHYGTTNPEGRDITRIEFFYGDIKVGRILSGKAIGPGSYVSLIRGEIELYFDSERVANALTILQGEPNLALYFVPDDKEPEQEQGQEGGIRHRSFDYYFTDASE